MFGGQDENVRLALHFTLPPCFAGGIHRVCQFRVDQFHSRLPRIRV